VILVSRHGREAQLSISRTNRIAEILIFCISYFMTTTLELGPKGTFTLPKKMREKFDLRDHSLISLEETPEGILIRPAVAFPIEIYSEERIKEFEQENNESIAEFFRS
jgi:bifunctional DNA-binding transcriptional regulator/antitoxin component of YhaV-PrlF toxin-antitoxin module